MSADLVGVVLLVGLMTLAMASPRLEDFYGTEYEDYYPTLFHRDHREFFISVDHRHLYCDCSIYGQRANASAQARIGPVPTSEYSQFFSGNKTDVISIVQLEQTHPNELDAADSLDTDRSPMTSSTLTGRQQKRQKQLMYVVLPCVITMIVLVIVITVIIISLLRRRLRYIDKSSDQEAVTLTSFGAGQPPPISGLQLCATQQHQLLLDTLTLHHPSDVTAGDDQSRVTNKQPSKQAPVNATAAESACSYHDWTYGNFAPARKEVTVKCYLDTSSVRAVLVPKTPPP